MPARPRAPSNEKTRRQPAQAAVAQTGIRFLLKNLERIKLMLFGELPRLRVKLEIGDVVRQRAAEQKLHREVIDALGVALPAGLLGFQPALRKHVRTERAIASNLSRGEFSVS